ncbi:MAG: hypothetical protein EOP51_22485, partial [Sphingobacteriales bacterium]
MVCVLLGLFINTASAQYAIGGTAGPNLTSSVYWLTWDKTASGSTLITTPVGADAAHIINGTYVWQFSPTVRITGVITNQVAVGGDAMQAYTPGDYNGDGLDLLYSGNNLTKPDSRGVRSSAIVTPYGGSVTFDIDIKVAILINNVWTDIVYPGMIIADAESLDAGGEYISANTPNSIAWQLLNKRTDNNSADDDYKMDLSNGGKSFRLYVANPPGNVGVQAVMFARGARNLTSVSMKGSGLTAMAIGFVLPFDLGDDPANYGTTGHYMERFQMTDVFTGDGTYSVVNYNTSPLLARATVFIGANNVDPDGQPVSGTNANDDDNSGNNDESTLAPANLPDIKVNQTGNVVITLPVTNTKNVPAVLHGWIDFNNDGVFAAADEYISVTVPANTANTNFTLTYPNASFRNKLKIGPLYARFRVTTSNLIDVGNTPVDERTISFAADGETEDYRFKDILGINISGKIVNDGNGSADAAISGTGLQTLSGSPLYVYLVNDANVVLNKTTPDASGNYSLINNNKGTYKVVVSTSNIFIGGTVTAIVPAKWVPSGAAYGINNIGNNGIQPGNPNLQVTVTTPGASLDITGVNIGLNQMPTVADDTGLTNTGTAVIIDVSANDADADGTLQLNQIRLVDPADNQKKTTVTIAGQGTYAVNASNGKVTFTPLPAFSGTATPIAYTIKDNFGSESAIALIRVRVVSMGLPDVVVTTIEVPVTTNVKANDGTAGTGATVIATQGAHGTTNVDADGNVTYTPNPGYAGIDTYTYTLTKDGTTSDPITVTVTVKPVGVNDGVITPINTSVTTTVTSNDGSSGVGNITITPSNATRGTTKVNPNGSVVYTPPANYIGKDVYTYTITKNGIVSDPVTVNVNVKPVGVNDTDATPLNTPVRTTVKANDGPSGI